MKSGVCAQKRRGKRVFSSQIIAVRRIARAVAARITGNSFLNEFDKSVFNVAVFARVVNEISAEAGNSDSRIRSQ